jgi:hypothetical protein
MKHSSQKSTRGKLLRFPLIKGRRRDYGARWVDADGRELGVTNAETMCLAPRYPHRLRISNGQYDHVIRCGICPNCVELDRRRLAERFRRAYEKHDGPLFFVQFKADIPTQNRLVRSARRARRLHVQSQLVRLGPGWAGLLVRDPHELEAWFAAREVETRTEPIRLKRGRRAFRRVAAGLAIARVRYGKNVNRYYGRGLPPVDKQSWSVERVDKYEPYDRATSPRAWTDDGRRLLPPLALSGKVIRLNAVRRIMEIPRSVDTYEAIEPWVRELIPKIAKPMDVVAVPKSAEECDRQRKIYQMVAKQEELRISDKVSASESTPPFFGGGLQNFSPIVEAQLRLKHVERMIDELLAGRAPPEIERERKDDEERRRQKAQRDERNRKAMLERLERMMRDAAEREKK